MVVSDLILFWTVSSDSEFEYILCARVQDMPGRCGPFWVATGHANCFLVSIWFEIWLWFQLGKLSPVLVLLSAEF